jgi:hypothetical protein
MKFWLFTTTLLGVLFGVGFTGGPGIVKDNVEEEEMENWFRRSQSFERITIQRILSNSFHSCEHLDKEKAAFGALLSQYEVPQSKVNDYLEALAELSEILNQKPTEAEKEVIKERVRKLNQADKAIIASIKGLENVDSSLAFSADPRFATFNLIRKKSTMSQKNVENSPELVMQWLKDSMESESFSKSFALALEASRVLAPNH